ncbi:protein Mdm4 isoform X1 [Phascolarctos cinereus]|uniref:Protein Mdm4 n=1 Tax=Phascolarctos cinereus TaxID=38626 RepID=A0A6P5LR97_PHACI|nr:protein Mdm4 isoform X1 [Phascolarctos cinereus]XP_020858574.1 protein Mdm4 isoform X1 [Phascolarctos cinereus]XP_020858575.1 protein Mdm4 isoform X1 [Phascolarctos cinereus]XP_020858576.1 protein Mdm4 isoform X1 [Phascolarctos cinereus]
MSLSSTAAHCSASENACRISPGQVNQVRPKLPLLKILQAAGAQGEMFTMKEVMHYLGQYIMVKQLYDQQEQHMVYCGGDLLGELLGLQSFSVKDPSPLYDMLRKNLVTATVTDAAQTLALAQDQSMDIPSQDQLKQGAEGSSSPRNGPEEGDAPALSTSQRKCRNPRSASVDEDFTENLTPNKSPRLDLVFEEWDVAGLPWWFLGNLRNNYTPRSNGSTDLQTNQDIDTAIVSDTTDDLWFLNESGSEQLNVAVKVEATDTEQASERGKESDKKLIEVRIFDDLEDSQCLSDDTDTEVTSEGEWQCTKCKKFNSPSKRYCFRCWALRKDWYSDCPKLSHSLSVSSIPAMPAKRDDRGIDVPDCRRTISDPLVRPKEPCEMEEKSKLLNSCSSVGFLDLAQSAESQETISSIGEQSDHLYEQNTDTAAMENCKNLFKPCKLCEKRPRDGNIIHGRTAHLVVCFRCAKRLKKTRAPCPICKKSIQMVIKIFVA